MIKLCLPFAFCLLTLPLLAQSQYIDKQSKQISQSLVPFYLELHQNPEISLKEKETSALLAGELEALGYDVKREFGGTVFDLVCDRREEYASCVFNC